MRFPHQYEMNIKALKGTNDSFMSGVELLEAENNKLEDLQWQLMLQIRCH